VSEVQRAVLAVDAQQPISTPHSLNSVVAERNARSQFNLVMMSLFAAIAALLAAIGIHGVVSYQVARRARELGIRMALGATRSHILRIVIGQAMAPVADGLIAGIAAALAVVTIDNEAVINVPASPNPYLMIEAVSAKGVTLGSETIYSTRGGRHHETIRIGMSESEMPRVVKLNSRIAFS
jgi:ABC-type antimicrobial peptide transport system permease subunit